MFNVKRCFQIMDFLTFKGKKTNIDDCFSGYLRMREEYDSLLYPAQINTKEYSSNEGRL